MTFEELYCYKFDFRSVFPKAKWFASLDALATLLAGLGLIGDVGGVSVGVDLDRLGSFDWLWFIFGFVMLEKMGNQTLINRNEK